MRPNPAAQPPPPPRPPAVAPAAELAAELAAVRWTGGYCAAVLLVDTALDAKDKLHDLVDDGVCTRT